MRLGGKVAVITGSTKGVGAATAVLFAGEGARVVVTGRTVEAGEAVVKKICGAGGEAVFIPADMTRESEVEALVNGAAEAFGGIDILVNNAAALEFMGEGGERKLTEQTTEDFEYILRVNLFGTFWTSKYAIRKMKERGAGSIVNISSVASLFGLPTVPSYASCKGALNALTRQIAFDYAGDNIRCNTVVIGVVVSGGLLDVMHSDAQFGALLDDLTLTRPLVNDDVAKAIAFLASDDAETITGVTLPVDGGLMIRTVIPDFSKYFGGLEPV